MIEPRMLLTTVAAELRKQQLSRNLCTHFYGFRSVYHFYWEVGATGVLLPNCSPRRASGGIVAFTVMGGIPGKEMGVVTALGWKRGAAD